MKRRHFIKTTSLGAVVISGTGISLLNKDLSAKSRNDNDQFITESSKEIPLAYDVDVLVVGGASSGVAAAAEAAKKGAKTLLISMETYLGEDICGTYRYWENPDSSDNELVNKIFPQDVGLPTPLQVKKALDDHLLEYGVDFLPACYVTDVLFNENGNPGGVIMANRRGRQAIRAKVIIDATPSATVARLANVNFSEFEPGEYTFKFITVGSDKKENPNMVAKEMPKLVIYKDKEYKAYEYHITLPLREDTYQAHADIEQKVRDLTWGPKQVDSSEFPFYVPFVHIEGKKRYRKQTFNIQKDFDERYFLPNEYNNLFVLSAIADISRETAEFLFKPVNIIATGHKIGIVAADLAKTTPVPVNADIKSTGKPVTSKGAVKELLSGLRSYMNIEYYDISSNNLPVLGTYDTVIVGGGTAGAPAGIGAAREGISTLVVEYLHGLGGVGTMGMIGAYYHGYREGFTKEVDKGVEKLGAGIDRKDKKWHFVSDWKKEWFRTEIRKSGGNIWFGVIGCGAYVVDNVVKGVVIATPYGRGVVLAKTVVDSTGSADIAIAAGSGYVYTNESHVAVQGAGLPFINPGDNYNNTDYTFIDDTDILDAFRTFVVAKQKFSDAYDIGKLLQTRERRRIIGDFTVSVLDVYNKRTYTDTISIHKSSFDTHGFTVDPFFMLKPPEGSGIDVIAYVPVRSLLPKGLEGIIVTGLGVSAHRDAMPVIRMQPCLQNQGYSVGIATAMASKNNNLIRYIDIKNLQEHLIKIENLPKEVLEHTDPYPLPDKDIQEAVKNVKHDFKDLEIVLWHTKEAVPMLKKEYQQVAEPAHKLIYAHILGIMWQDEGWQTLEKEVKSYEHWDEGWNYTGMGQFGASMSQLDSLIIALGRTRKDQALDAIIEKAKLLTPDSAFSHFRAVCVALEALGNPNAVKTIAELLNLPGVRGHSVQTIEEAKEMTVKSHIDTSTRNKSLRELVLARALYKLGDSEGIGREILKEYSRDMRGHYYRHAKSVLEQKADQL
jgi:flavin-dependent dehydrogenase